MELSDALGNSPHEKDTEGLWIEEGEECAF